MKKKSIILGTAGLAAVLVAGLTLWMLYAHFHKPDLLKVTQKKVGFTLFITSNTSTWRLDKETVLYDKTTGVATMTLRKNNVDNKIVMSQQATPDPFTDIPNYSSIFFNKLNQYKELNLSIGKAVLTRPTELKGGQSAIMNTRGTLMFLHPDKDLSDDEWKTVFQGLETL